MCLSKYNTPNPKIRFASQKKSRQISPKNPPKSALFGHQVWVLHNFFYRILFHFNATGSPPISSAAVLENGRWGEEERQWGKAYTFLFFFFSIIKNIGQKKGVKTNEQRKERNMVRYKPNPTCLVTIRK